MQKPSVLLVATMDTKFREAGFIESCLKASGCSVQVMDAGIRGDSPVPVTFNRQEVALAGGKTLSEVQSMGHEGKSLDIMLKGACKIADTMIDNGVIRGVIGLGGSMGTTLGTGVMRRFPIGVPKVMISTMASRDTRAFVGTKDILMLHAVCDLSGLNRFSKKILHNGAMALVGMASQNQKDISSDKSMIFVSTLGTTEKCVQEIRAHLEKQGKEVVAFHTVGSGGKAMEELMESESIEAVVDLSLHEMADHRFGGDYDAGSERGSVALKKGIPVVLVPGNIDFLVAGPLDQTRKNFPNRPYHVHNSAITVVRTTREEIESLAEQVGDYCNAAHGHYTLVIPMKGFSAFDAKEGPLHDPEAPARFVKSLEARLSEPSRIHTLPYHINDSEFSNAVIHRLHDLLVRDQRF
jgi:uncharacterized protein (UPF0261 family)